MRFILMKYTIKFGKDHCYFHLGHSMIKTFNIFLCPPIRDPSVSCIHSFSPLLCLHLQLDCLSASLLIFQRNPFVILMDIYVLATAFEFYQHLWSACALKFCLLHPCFSSSCQCVVFHTNKTFQNILY